MFDEKEIHAYRQIGAPKELKESIENIVVSKKPGNRKLIYSFSAAAAGLVLFVTAFLFLNQNRDSLKIFVDGQQLSEAGITIAGMEQYAMAAARMISYPVRIPFEIPDVEVSFQPSQGTVTENAHGSYCWNLENAMENSEYELVIQDKNRNYSIILHFDEENSGWTVSLGK